MAQSQDRPAEANRLQGDRAQQPDRSERSQGQLVCAEADTRRSADVPVGIESEDLTEASEADLLDQARSLSGIEDEEEWPR